ncbi:MAG: Maf family protein [Coxiellaceae bacterium]|jgi:septum formation protein|nr:Maf family protein [Coxiellaceae bacterium]
MQIILGSQSRDRKKILKQIGYKFLVMDPNIDEKSIRHKTPKKLVLDLAYAKASALLPKIKKPATLITADEIVVCNNKILEKPKDKNEAKKFLRMYSKFSAKTITAVVVTNTANKKQKVGVDIAQVWFAPIPKNIITKIVTKERVLHWAGGFSIDAPLLKKYVLKIKGDRDSIKGLPTKLTKKLIAEIQ